MTGGSTDVVRLAVWSGPRNISTALMRSWDNRSDSVVVDEPFYAHFLSVSGRDDPGRDEVLAEGESDWRVVADQLLAPVSPEVRVFYSKQMAHHVTAEMGHDFLAGLVNVLLIRDPREVVASYVRSRPDVTVADIGLHQQVALHDELADRGIAPPVIDSADFLRDPAGCLDGLCRALGLAFEDAMLTWPPGPRASDGVWGRYWYDSLWQSTGFEPYRRRDVTLSGVGAEVAADCLPAYERLHGLRWTDWQEDPWTSR